MKTHGVVFRKAVPQDGQYIWQTVADSKKLDVNSAYCYIMMCQYFSDTCWVAESEGEIIGFVTAFIKPSRPDVLFVWQIAVASEHRGKRIAESLLRQLITSEYCSNIRHVETTISPSNAASTRLFAKFAQELAAPLTKADGFPSDLFPESTHEDEQLVRIGAIPKRKKALIEMTKSS